MAGLVAEQKLGFDFDHALGSVVEDELSSWHVAAGANDAAGLCLYGLAHRYGIGVPQDAKRGLELNARAAQIRDAEAMAVYSRLLRGGNRDTAPDPDAANEWLSKALAAKSALAADALPVEGARELAGDGDIPAALKAFEQFAKEGNLNAKVELAYTLRLGWLVAPDIDRSVKLLTQAAEAGHVGAMIELAEVYANGRYVKPDVTVARHWYKAAADTGDARALYVAAKAYAGRTLGAPEPQITGLMIRRLGQTRGPTAKFALFMLEQTLSPSPDDPEGLKKIQSLLMPAAIGGETETYLWLSRLYRHGVTGIPADLPRSKRYLDWGMAANSPAAVNDLACAYRYGWYAPADEQAAIPLFFKAARLGNAPAMTSVAMRMGTGRGVPLDVPASDAAYLAAALAGDPDAMYQMAKLHREGDGHIKPDPELAQMWAREAIDNGAPDAALILFQLERDHQDPSTPLSQKQIALLETATRNGGYYCESELGQRYLGGNGLPVDVQLGLSLLTEAADRDPRGHVLVALGDRWQHGIGVSKDVAKARRCFEASASRGNGDGWARLGFLYVVGQGVDKDGAEAARCYEKGMALGSVDAAAGYGEMLILGDLLPRDVDRAIKLLRDAADRGSGNAAVRMTQLLVDGFAGATKNLDEGLKWAKRAVDLHQPDAAYIVSIHFREAGDFKSEREWLELGDRQGSGDCTNSIGIQYRFGHGVEQDFKQAAKAYQRAVDRGCRLAMCNLAWCYENGNGVDKDLGEAFRLQLRAAMAGEPEAMFHTGRMYLDGIGVRRDQQAGFTWLTKSADAGFENAKILVSAARAKGLIR
jgi:TPR repeat protein